MKKAIFIAFIFLAGCSSKDEQFCNCLIAGKDLNEFSQKLLTEEVTQDKAAKLKLLKATQKKACAEYQTMMGDEMLTLKAECN